MEAVSTSDTEVTLPFVDRNSLLSVALIAASLTLGVAWNPLGWLLWPAFLILEDILYFGFGRSLLDTEVAVQRGYQFAHVFLDRVSGHGRDLGFNLYDGELCKTGQRAQTDNESVRRKTMGSALRPTVSAAGELRDPVVAVARALVARRCA